MRKCNEKFWPPALLSRRRTAGERPFKRSLQCAGRRLAATDHSKVCDLTCINVVYLILLSVHIHSPLWIPNGDPNTLTCDSAGWPPTLVTNGYAWRIAVRLHVSNSTMHSSAIFDLSKPNFCVGGRVHHARNNCAVRWSSVESFSVWTVLNMPRSVPTSKFLRFPGTPRRYSGKRLPRSTFLHQVQWH